MKMKNLLIGGMSLALVACLSVGATLAYFTATDGPKTNTFKFADGLTVKLEEDADDNSNGNASSTTSGIAYTELVPGVDIGKDVTATFKSDIDAYFFVKIESQKPEGSDTDGTPLTIKKLLLDAGWQAYDVTTGTASGVTLDDTYGEYVYDFTYDKQANQGKQATVVADLFDNVFVDGSVENGDLNDIKISVKAIQKDGFDTMKEAYEAVDYQSNT